MPQYTKIFTHDSKIIIFNNKKTDKYYMSTDIFRTNQLIIIMLNQKHSYLTFNKGRSQKCH